LDPELDNPLLAHLTPDQFADRMVREILARRKLGRNKGGKVLFYMKMPAALKVGLREAAIKLGVTMTEIVTWHLEHLLPILEAAEPVDVPGWKEYVRRKRCGRPRTSSRKPYPSELRRKAIAKK
jgi:hypothetical protein